MGIFICDILIRADFSHFGFITIRIEKNSTNISKVTARL